MVLFLVGQTHGAELLHDLAEERRRRGEIEQVVAGRALFLVDRRQPLGQLLIKVGIAEVAGVVVEPIGEPFPQLLLDGGAGELLDVGGDPGAKFGRAERFDRNPDHRELFGEQLAARQIVERRDQQALGQITGGSENHHHARIAGALCGFRWFSV